MSTPIADRIQIFRPDILLASGALAVVDNKLLNEIAQRLYAAVPLLDALIAAAPAEAIGRRLPAASPEAER